MYCLVFLGLPDLSVDVVIASQSFHWFANTSALREINRVLVPGGMFGIFSVMPDYSVPWMADLWEFQAPLYKKKSIVLPFQDGWKQVFSSTTQKLFSDLEGNSSFSFTMSVASFEQAYDCFASGSVIASGTDPTKESFRELFNEVVRKHFLDKGIDLDGIMIKVFMYWCTKEI